MPQHWCQNLEWLLHTIFNHKALPRAPHQNPDWILGFWLAGCIVGPFCMRFFCMCLVTDWLKCNFLIQSYNRLLVAQTWERGHYFFPPSWNLALLKTVKQKCNSWYVIPELTCFSLKDLGSVKLQKLVDRKHHCFRKKTSYRFKDICPSRNLRDFTQNVFPDLCLFGVTSLGMI